MSGGTPQITRVTVRSLDLAAVVAIVATAGLVYRLAGVSFDASTFPSYMQFIDRDLLATRPLESLWYSHAHPPGLNVLAAIGVNLFGTHAPAFFSVCFHVLGVVLGLAVFALTLRLTSSRVVAYACTAVLVFSPAFALYQNWFMYTFIETALLTLSAVAMYKYLDTSKAVWAITLFSVLAALLLTRGFFHLGWMVIVVVGVAAAGPHSRRVLAAASLPLLVVILWYGKNLYYFGSFSASSMLGLGLSNITTLTLQRTELEPLVENGTLSSYALLSRYENTEALFESSIGAPTGIAVLDQVRKSAGDFNYNYRGILEVDRQFTKDALTVIRTFPASYLIGLIISNRLFFSPTSMNEYLSPENRLAARPFERAFTPLLSGVTADTGYIVQPHFGFDRPPSLEVNTSVPLIVAWLVVLAAGYVRVRRVFVSPVGLDRAAHVTLAYMLFTMLYAYIVGTALELGENYRYRFVVEPLFLIACATLATDLCRRLIGVARRAA